MIRLGEGHIEDGDRPKYPHKIIKTKVCLTRIAISFFKLISKLIQIEISAWLKVYLLDYLVCSRSPQWSR